MHHHRTFQLVALAIAMGLGVFQSVLLAQAPATSASPTTRRAAGAPLRVTNGGLRPPI
jgi:hypothetical protein